MASDSSPKEEQHIEETAEVVQPEIALETVDFRSPEYDDPITRINIIKDLPSSEVNPNFFIMDESFPSPILGPVIVTHPSGSAALRRFVPLVPKEDLLLKKEINLHFLLTSRPFRTWPVLDKPFIEWVDRIQAVKEKEWKRLGIFDLIQFSRTPIKQDGNLIGAAICYWSTSHNNFHFPCGMMTITVLDLAALIGTIAAGTDEINGLLRVRDDTDPFTLSKANKAYSTFLINWKKKEGEVDRNEYLAFLLYWLCKFIFCVPANQIIKEHLLVAQALAEGMVIELGPYILAILYKGMSDLVDQMLEGKIRDNVTPGGPFWILQLWLHAYFPEFGFRDLCNKIPHESFRCYGHKIVQIPLVNQSFQRFERIFQFFFNLTERDPSLFMPFFDRSFGPKFFKRRPIELCSDPNEETKETYSTLWSQYLMSRDIHRMTNFKGKNNKCGVEVYAPHYCARQFGLTQSIPLPVFFTYNHSFLDRAIFKYSADIATVNTVTETLREEFLKQFFFFEEIPCTTPLFDRWWREYVDSYIRSDDVAVIFGRFSFDSPVKEKPEIQQEGDGGNGRSRSKTAESSSVQVAGGQKRARPRKAKRTQILPKDQAEEQCSSGEGEADLETVIRSKRAKAQKVQSSVQTANPLSQKAHAPRVKTIAKRKYQKQSNVLTVADETYAAVIPASPLPMVSTPVVVSAVASTQCLREANTQLILTPQSVDKSVSIPQPTDKAKAPRTISLADMDAFFQSLSSDMPASSTASTNSLSPASISQVSRPSRAEVEEALDQINEAIKMPPVRFDHPRRVSRIEKALKVLTNLDESSGITVRQKAEILSLTKKFKTLPTRANKAVKAKNNLVKKESLRLTLNGNLKSYIAQFRGKKIETVKAEEEIQELLTKLKAAKKKKETLADEIGDLYEKSVSDKKELDELTKEWCKYEEEARLATEEEKAVDEEWKSMKDLIFNVSESITLD